MANVKKKSVREAGRAELKLNTRFPFSFVISFRLKPKREPVCSLCRHLSLFIVDHKLWADNSRLKKATPIKCFRAYPSTSGDICILEESLENGDCTT